MGRVFASKDFLAGGLYMAFGLLGLWLGRSLDVGTASAMEADVSTAEAASTCNTTT